MIHFETIEQAAVFTAKATLPDGKIAAITFVVVDDFVYASPDEDETIELSDEVADKLRQEFIGWYQSRSKFTVHKGSGNWNQN